MTIFQDKSLLGNSIEEITNTIKSKYYFKGIIPTNVAVTDSEVVLEYPIPSRINRIFNDACKECNCRNWTKALQLINKLLDELPVHYEALCVKAQVMREQGKHQQALKYIQQSVSLNPHNEYGQLLLGNIYMDENEYDKAVNAYIQVCLSNKDNVMARSNIAGIYYKQGKYQQALEYCDEVMKIDNTYPNIYICIILCFIQTDRPTAAFDCALEGLKNAKNTPENAQAYDKLREYAIEAAKMAAAKVDYMTPIKKELTELEKIGGLEIKFEKDPSLSVYAQMRYSKTRNRNFHEVVYNPKNNVLLANHYIMHELMHLEMAINASKNNSNMICFSSKGQKQTFLKENEAYFNKLPN